MRAKLQSYGDALQLTEGPDIAGARYFLLALDPAAERLEVTSYAAANLEQATETYLAVERELSGKPGAEAVLVSVESLQTLRRAYPNFYLDTRVFLEAVDQALQA